MVELLVAYLGWQSANDPAKAQKYAKDTHKATVRSVQPNPSPRLNAMWTFFFEDFETMAVGNPPTGWTVNDNDADGFTWQVVAPGSMPISSDPSTGNFLLYNDDAIGTNNGPNDDEAITPVIDLTTLPAGAILNGYFLSYAFNVQVFTNAGESPEIETTQVWIDYFDPTTNTWNSMLLATYAADTLGNATFDLTAVLTGMDSAKIRFHYYEGPAGDWGWGSGFDDINLYADVTFPDDISVDFISDPGFVFYTFYPADQAPMWPMNGDITVIVSNPGTNDQTNVNVSLEVNGNVVGTQTIASLTAGSSDTLVFTGVPIDQTSIVKAYHDLAADVNNLNDTLEILLDYTNAYKVGDTLNYASTLTAPDAIGTTGNLGSADIAVKYDSSDVYLFATSSTPYYIKAVFFHHAWAGGAARDGGQSGVWLAPDAGGVPDHANPIWDSLFALPDTLANLYVIELDTNIMLTTSLLPFYAGRYASLVADTSFPFGFDFGAPCVPGKSCWIRADSIPGGWNELITFGIDGSWVLGVIVDTTPAVGISEGSIAILPNDAKLLFVKDGNLFFNKPVDRDMKIRFYNVAGRLVKEVFVREGTKRLYIGNLPKGSYIYITDDNKAGTILVR